MKLLELLDPRRIIVPLDAQNVRDATAQLARALAEAGELDDEARFTQLLKHEWPEDIVSVGGRAFLPHFRTDAVRHVTLALGVAPKPICRANDPNRCARIVVLILAPVAEASTYLRAMSAVAQALSSDDVVEALHLAADPAGVLAIAGLGETAVPADLTVRDIMTGAVAAVGPETPLREAAQLMVGRDVRAVPVIGAAREVLGLLTDGHLLNHLLPATVSALSTGHLGATKRKRRSPGRPAAADPGEIPVRDVMDRSVLCLSEDQTVADVAALMLAKDVDRFPVTRDGALVGFLTRGDIVRKLLGG